MAKTPVYMMPGMAANPKIFEYIKLPETYEIYYLHWIMPLADENLSRYTTRLLQQIKHENPILIGVSFGGIIIQEMAKQIPVRQLVLISTIKHHEEFSPFLKKSYQYYLYKLFPSKLMQYIDQFEKYSISKNFTRKMRLYKTYMDFNEPQYLNWAIAQVLQWKQTQKLSNFVHIVGEKDKVFPEKYIHQPKIVVPKGRHDMIIFKSGWFNKYLPALLK